MVQPTIVPALAALVVMTTIAANAQPQTHAANLPPDVAWFIARSVGCQDAMKKLQVGIEDSDQLAATFQSLRCSDVPADQQALRRKYAAAPDVLTAINAKGWVKVVRRVPVTPAPETNPSTSSQPHAN
jgi:hypothetical protein